MVDRDDDESRRQFPRFDLFALVRVQLEDETLVLEVRNLSLGGALLTTERDLADFPIGSLHEVLVFDAAHAERQPARVSAEVVRHEAGAFAVRFRDRDPLATIRLTLLFAELNSQLAMP